jgi:hypothetical protein
MLPRGKANYMHFTCLALHNWYRMTQFAVVVLEHNQWAFAVYLCYSSRRGVVGLKVYTLLWTALSIIHLYLASLTPWGLAKLERSCPRSQKRFACHWGIMLLPPLYFYARSRYRHYCTQPRKLHIFRLEMNDLILYW